MYTIYPAYNATIIIPSSFVSFFSFCLLRKTTKYNNNVIAIKKPKSTISPDSTTIGLITD